jgi:lysophospholipase L1-like esterase
MEPERERSRADEPRASSDRRFRVAALVAGLLLWVAITGMATELIEYSRNTLARNGAWISSKPLMQVHVMGAEHFLATRNALSRNRLNLGEWFGDNEVHVARPLQPSNLAVRFRLDPGAYLDVIVDRRESGHQGIRVSRTDRFPSGWYRAERTGRIVERGPVPVPPASLDGGWHELGLVFSPDGVATSIDGERVASVPIRIDGERFVGFGSGLQPVALDRVRITGRNGETLLDETFRNRRSYGSILKGVGAVSLLAVLLGAWRVVSSGTGLALRLAAYRWLTALVVILVLLATSFAFDYAVWSRRYVYDTIGHLPDQAKPLHLAVLFESLRAGLFGMGGGTLGNVTGEVGRPLPALRRSLSAWDGSRPIPPDRRIRFRGSSPLVADFLTDQEIRTAPEKVTGMVRVAFLGTSQTRGVGAETITDTFVARIHARLAAELGSDRLETYNFAIPGSRSSELLRLYRESWGEVRPDLLVVNLSNNDSDRKLLIENLRALAAQTRRSGGAIVFVLEAKSTEKDLRWILRSHRAVSALGAELGVPVWDLHGYLASDGVFDSGRLWWDEIHLSSYGQSLAADWLAARMIPLLRGREGADYSRIWPSPNTTNFSAVSSRAPIGP